MNVRSVTVFKKRMKKKACDRKRYKADSESKKDSTKHTKTHAQIHLQTHT